MGEVKTGGRHAQFEKDELDAEMRGLQETPPACPLQRPRSLLGKEGRVLRSGHYVELGRVLCPRGGPLVCGVCGRVCLFTAPESKSYLPSGSEGDLEVWLLLCTPSLCLRGAGAPLGWPLWSLRQLSSTSPLSPAEAFLSGCPLPPANIALLISLPAIVGPSTLHCGAFRPF